MLWSSTSPAATIQTSQHENYEKVDSTRQSLHDTKSDVLSSWKKKHVHAAASANMLEQAASCLKASVAVITLPSDASKVRWHCPGRLVENFVGSMRPSWFYISRMCSKHFIRFEVNAFVSTSPVLIKVDTGFTSTVFSFTRLWVHKRRVSICRTLSGLATLLSKKVEAISSDLQKLKQKN